LAMPNCSQWDGIPGPVSDCRALQSATSVVTEFVIAAIGKLSPY